MTMPTITPYAVISDDGLLNVTMGVALRAAFILEATRLNRRASMPSNQGAQKGQLVLCWPIFGYGCSEHLKSTTNSDKMLGKFEIDI